MRLSLRPLAFAIALAGFAGAWMPHSIASDGADTWLALGHHRDLFRLGGVFPSEARILAAVEAAVADLSQPLALVQALIANETREKVKGA